MKRTKIETINFHPAPDYPGTGCYNFVLHEELPEYGAMHHHMKPEVDAGDIIAVKRFPIYDGEKIETVIGGTYENMIVLFYEIMAEILKGNKLPISKEKWKRKATTRKELNELATITPDMNKTVIKKRIVSTTHGNWKPTVILGSHTFELKTTDLRGLHEYNY